MIRFGGNIEFRYFSIDEIGLLSSVEGMMRESSWRYCVVGPLV